MPDQTAAENLRVEFNKWAESGKGEGMERDHLPIVLPMLEMMSLQSEENVLDVGCGSGWLVRLIASYVDQGRVVGIDVSDEMIRLARRATVDLPNVFCAVGSVDEIPWQPSFFTRVVSVESAYYWPDPARGLREIFRVTAERGEAWILINYFKDNPHCHQWGSLLEIPAKLLSAEEWSAMFRDAGFTNIIHERIPDPTPNPTEYKGRWFRDAKQLADFRREGALLIRATKPAAR